MNNREKVESVLAQENYKVEGGKIFRLNNFGEWSEQRLNARNQIQLRDSKGNAELFDWSLVQSVINGEIAVLPITEKAYDCDKKEALAKDEISQFGKPLDGDAQKVLNDTYKKSLRKKRVENKLPLPKDYLTSTEIATALKIKTPRTKIGSAEIKIIRKMLSDGKSINKITEAINSNRFAVSYIVKQIKAGKKLKNEK